MNFDLDGFYSFRGINRVTSNVDLRDGSNYYMYHHTDDRWRVMPWDLDMMYAPVRHQSGVIRADACLGNPEIRTEFRNRCRELADLLFSDIDRHGGHAAQLVEELSQVINPTGVPLTMVDADEYMWSYHPRTPGSHRGPWYSLSKSETRLSTNYTRTIPTADHEGFQQNIIDFMFDTRAGGGFAVNDTIEDGYGFGYLSMEAADSAIPDKPTVTYTGDGGFPAAGLRFTSSAFSDPGGSGTFASMEWRVGKITNPSTPDYVAGEPWVYEVEPGWESGAVAPFAAEVSLPLVATRPGATYRARVRHFDNTGRASHWSEPIEFVASEPAVAPYQASIVISEIMYHPVAGSQLEFIELYNVGASTVDLTGVRFTKGIDFDFLDNTMLAPGAYLLVVNDLAAFEAEYGNALPVAGEWEEGDNLSNGGENLKLSLGLGTAIHEFDYSDDLPWPTSPDGGGHSLTLACAESGVDHSDPGVWRSSVAVGGSPGTGDAVGLASWLTASGLSPGDELSDGDGDGLPALFEYGAGGNVGANDGVGAPSAELVGGEFRLSYTRDRSADDVQLIGEYSLDLSAWLPVEALSIDAGAAGIDTVVARLPGGGSELRVFYRVRVVEK